MPGMITVRTDAQAARDQLSSLNWLRQSTKAAELVRQPVKDELRRQTPVAPKTIKGYEPGTLRDSITDELRAGSGVVRLRYTSDVEWADWVIDGTGPHEILPREARYLHWVDPGTGENIFRTRVWHPGTQPNDFPRRAADRMMPLVSSAFGAVFERF
jgi:hypothetical protein